MIAIIDYGAGNIKSIRKAFEFLGENCVLTSDRELILAADKVILPGVGSFGAAMEALKAKNLDKTIYEAIDSKMPFLGICLGMQLMFEESEESPGVAGLGVFKGKFYKFDREISGKVPQIGWNRLNVKKSGGLFEGLDNPYVYFVHSYYLKAADKNDVSATCDYGNEFDAAAEKNNVFLTQFHPEKSGEAGLKILKNFLGKEKLK